jgi:dTDP-glucose pyrophosphorylase
MRQVALVMPMAGRGSRFGKGGVCAPKPLRTLWGRPFFWWATESARRAFDIVETVFVLLQEHVKDFAIQEQIRSVYPDARFVIVPEVTRGAAETAMLGVDALEFSGPLIVNDTDHAFIAAGAESIVDGLEDGISAALLTFHSTNPAYSYARLSEDGDVIGTAEKQVISEDAIAGAYLFADPQTYRRAYQGYQAECRYHEVFISGLYDRLIAAGGRVELCRLEDHISFGTPEELARLAPQTPQPWAAWS